MPFLTFFVLVWLTFLSLAPSHAAVLSIAHRGNSLFAPENTAAAFAASQSKADLVETDVRVSSDGYLVLMHDATVDRTTDGTGAVSGKTLAQLKLLDAGSWFAPEFAGQRILTMEEMITNTLPFAIPLIEHKAGSAAAYVNEFERIGTITNIVVQSFDWNFLAGVHALNPSIPLCALGSGALNVPTLMTITNSGATTVAWEKSSVTAAEVNLVHSWNLKLFVWTVDGPEINNFIQLGVDGIISNDPGLVKNSQTPPTNQPTAFGEGLVAYWKLDDGLTLPFTSTVSDSKGTNAGTLIRNDGASHWFGEGTARLAGCLKLEATNAFVTLPQTPALDIQTNGLTLSAWVRLQNLPSQLATSFGAIFDSTTDCYVLYLDRSARELRFKITDADNDAARPGIPESFLQTNQWLHVAATFSGTVGPVSGQATIYLNGQPRDVHTGADNTSPVGLTANVKAGQVAAWGREGPAGGNYFTGYMDDVALWRRGLTPQEIEKIYSSGQAGQSIGDLLIQPSSLLQITSADLNVAGTHLQIDFQNLGPWTSFQLRRSTNWNSPFYVVPGLTPSALGGGAFRFTYPLGTNALEYFRVEGAN